MFSTSDLQQLAERGIPPAEAERQLGFFRNPPPFAHLERPCVAGDGVLRLSEAEQARYDSIGLEALKVGRAMKFVPASGAATRMFQALQADANGKEAARFREDLPKFALHAALGSGDPLESLLRLYASAPKALIPFHSYHDGARTAFEEQLREAEALGIRRLHFTVSPEHRLAFESLLHSLKRPVEAGFSEQKPSTDTLAGNPDGTPFRDAEGRLVFRPGGHGALLSNLADLGADLLLIKNIDNITHARLWEDQLRWKRILLGVLLAQGPATERPRRVCGVVKNTGEPGGGPFWVRRWKSIDRQIVESAQVDMADPSQKQAFGASTHFNPVDIACLLRDEKGRPFDLAKFRDDSAVFVAKKSKDGKPLLALELPGLWNGSMADWETIFVEVPLETFNPVKTVLDLLRPAHQAA